MRPVIHLAFAARCKVSRNRIPSLNSSACLFFIPLPAEHCERGARREGNCRAAADNVNTILQQVTLRHDKIAFCCFLTQFVGGGGGARRAHALSCLCSPCSRDGLSIQIMGVWLLRMMDIDSRMKLRRVVFRKSLVENCEIFMTN